MSNSKEGKVQDDVDSSAKLLSTLEKLHNHVTAELERHEKATVSLQHSIAIVADALNQVKLELKDDEKEKEKENRVHGRHAKRDDGKEIMERHRHHHEHHHHHHEQHHVQGNDCEMLDPSFRQRHRTVLQLGECANVTIMPLWKETMGVHIDLSRSSNAPECARALSRHALSSKVSVRHGGYTVRRMRRQAIGMVKKLNIDKSMDYERLLEFGQCTRRRHGTAIIVNGQLFAPNLFHAMVQVHAFDELVRIFDVQLDQVRAVVGPTRGPWVIASDRDVFADGQSDDRWATLFESLITAPQHRSRAAHVHVGGNGEPFCVAHVFFLESDILFPGAMWQLSSPHVSFAEQHCALTHFSAFRDFQRRLIDANVPAADQRDVEATRATVRVCFMSREGRGTTRTFSDHLRDQMRASMHALVDAHSGQLQYEELSFGTVGNQPISKKEQARISSRCNVLFGPHGAGLTHQLWMNARSNRTLIIEINESGPDCRRYFGNLAYALGHQYVCFNHLGHSDVHVGQNHGQIEQFNVRTLAELIEKFVEEHCDHSLHRH